MIIVRKSFHTSRCNYERIDQYIKYKINLISEFIQTVLLIGKLMLCISKSILDRGVAVEIFRVYIFFSINSILDLGITINNGNIKVWVVESKFWLNNHRFNQFYFTNASIKDFPLVYWLSLVAWLIVSHFDFLWIFFRFSNFMDFYFSKWLPFFFCLFCFGKIIFLNKQFSVNFFFMELCISNANLKF